jgi:protocatechuate 3,4-dioxygenase beta subunit
MPDNDDVLIGRLMTRREVLAMAGVAGAALVVGCSNDDNGGSPTARATNAPTAGATAGGSTAMVPACVVVPELTEGPYFIDDALDRSDIRSDPSDNSVSDGDQLDITVNVSQVGGDGSCTPLESAQVDIWQCDALGVYSGVDDIAGQFQTSGQQFLRGYQRTDGGGQAVFTTIYPGWYMGRATHIHFKVRTDDGYEFTSQWFFDDALSDTVHTQGVYESRGAAGRPQNDADGIYQGTNGLLTLDVSQAGGIYVATFDIGLRI